MAMLSENKVIALFCIVDDMLKAMRHSEDIRVKVKDSEIITTAIVSALYFYGHQHNARAFMKMKGYMPHMLDKGQFNRRLHRLAALLFELVCSNDRSKAKGYGWCCRLFAGFFSCAGL